jgi:hypothetical protein
MENRLEGINTLTLKSSHTLALTFKKSHTPDTGYEERGLVRVERTAVGIYVYGQ